MRWLSEELPVGFQLEKHSYSHQDEVYEIKTPENIFYLKINASLEAERDNLLKLQPFVRVPAVISFRRVEGKDHLLITEVPGKNLAELVGQWTNEAIVKEFAQAVRTFHAIDVVSVFPEKNESGLVVLHGDMSLPNVICTQPGSVSYIDVGQVSVGSPDIDLADVLWSLQRNMGPGYGESFLEEYGNITMTATLEAALKYRHTT